MTAERNSHPLSIEIDGDLILKKGEDVLLTSEQLYAIVKILAEVKLLLPDSWVLEAKQDLGHEDTFRITLSPPDFDHIPLEPITDPTKYHHKEGSFYFDDNNIEPWNIVDKINEKLLEFRVPEENLFHDFWSENGKNISYFQHYLLKEKITR